MSARLEWDSDGANWPHRQASRFVQMDALRWHVQQFIHPSADAPTLLLLHGTGASTHSWSGLISELLPHFSMVALDLPGHGFTQMPVGGPSSDMFSITGMARGVAGLLHSLALAPDCVLGHSAGAAVAVRMCLDGLLAPRSILSINGALVPLDGLAGRIFSPLAKLLTVAPLVPELFAWRAAHPVVLDRLISGTGSRLDAQGIALYRQLIANPGHAAGALGMMANWDLHALWRDLRSLETPLHLVVGSNDLIVPPHTAQRVADLLARQQVAPVLVLQGLGHLAHEERPDQLAAIVLERLQPFRGMAGRT